MQQRRENRVDTVDVTEFNRQRSSIGMQDQQPWNHALDRGNRQRVAKPHDVSSRATLVEIECRVNDYPTIGIGMPRASATDSVVINRGAEAAVPTTTALSHPANVFTVAEIAAV